MANKKAEILTMDGQVVSPITLATNILLDDGRTAQDLLDSRDESMFSPTITTSSSISKVGQGDNVDFSENVVDGAYKSCVLKGKTLVNYNAEGNDRNEYVCMPSLEGNNLTVNDTVEGKVKSAILSGQTLVNLQQKGTKWNINGNGGNASYSSEEGFPLSKLKPSTKYLIKFNKDISSFVGWVFFAQGVNTVNNINGDYAIVTTLDVLTTSKTGIHVYPKNNTLLTKELLMDVDVMIIEYQDGMENWDIPYFEGVQSVKLPVLTTTGKNLFDVDSFKKEENRVNTGGAYSSFEIKLKPNTKYSFNRFTNDGYGSTCYFAINTVQGSYIGNLSWLVHSDNQSINTQQGKFTTDNTGIVYISGIFTNDNLNKTFELIQNLIIVEGDIIPTSYEPYKSNILTVNEDVTLRGIGDVKDTLDLMTGELTQCIGEIVLDGSGDEGYTINGSITSDGLTRFIVNVDIPNRKQRGNAISNLLPTVNNSSSYGVFNGVGLNIIINCSTVDELRTWLQQNPVTIQYELTQESVKTVVLSDNVVYSYKDTTHYTCSSEEGSLLPTLAIEEGVKYKAIIKPSTKYSVVFNRTEVASGLTVDLGGATANVVSTTLGKNIVQITTPPTLSHNYVIFKGLGNVIKDVQVIEGDVADDVEYFEGMVNVKNPIVINCNSPIIFSKGGRL